MADPRGSCLGCPLATEGTGFVVEPYGEGTTGILLLGESLGESEVEEGRQFAGKAGQTLDRIITRTKDPLTGAPLRRLDFWTANVLSCRPPNNELTGAPYEQGAISHCRPNLEGVIRRLKPKVIVALGNQPLRWLTGYWGIEHWRGSLLESPYGWVIPSLHPSYIQRGKWNLVRAVVNDLLRALEVARNGPSAEQTDYLLYPTFSQLQPFAEEWRIAGRPILAFDIETSWSGGKDEQKLVEVALEETDSYQISRLSLAFRRGHGITIPWTTPFIEWAQALLAEADELTVWNESFDVPRLVASGVRFKPTALIYDAMWAWHWMEPSLPYNLQFASSLLLGPWYRAWKHTSGEDIELYSVKDSDYLLQNFQHIRGKLVKDGRWEMFVRHVVKVSRVLRKMSAVGVAVDQPQRQRSRAAFQRLLGRVQRQVQPHVPAPVRPLHKYKITWEQIEKKLGPQNPTEWITISTPLTEKEQARITEREARRAAKALEAEAKRLAKAAKKAEGGGRKRKAKQKGVAA